MSILTDKLPNTVVIDGKECPIQTDFRVWLRFTRLTEDGTLSMPDKVVQIIRLVYGYLPPKLAGAINALMQFYSADSVKPSAKRGGADGQRRIFDYEADAEYIYAAFYQQYGIDLCTEDMHWHQFKALFSALDESTQFVKIMGYRSADLSKIKDKEQRAFYRRMQKKYALPDMRTEEERDAAVSAVLEEFFK